MNKKMPKKGYYVIPAVIAVIGIALFVYSIFYIVHNAIDVEKRFFAPSQQEMHLETAGKYTVYYENKTEIDGKAYCLQSECPSVTCSLYNVDADEYEDVELPKGTTRYDINGFSGCSVFEFNIEEPGDYIIELTLDEEGQKAAFAVSPKNNIGLGVLLILISVVLWFFLPVGIFLYIFFTRKKFKSNNNNSLNVSVPYPSNN